MTHEQRTAEIREALLIGRKCSLYAEGELSETYDEIGKAIVYFDDFAAECLRLREDKIELKRTIAFAYLYFVSKTTEAEEKELGRLLAKHYDPTFRRQALDAAKEVK